MISTKLDFEERKEEIENYIRFLKIFDDDETKIHYIENKETVQEGIQNQFQTILIANAFLILYNLIESTIRNTIIAIYKSIFIRGESYGTLTTKLKQIWIKQETANLNGSTFRLDTMHDNIYEIAERIINGEPLMFSNESLDISGNIDAQKIRDIAKKIGFEPSPNGRNLLIIKNKRNRLAHGEQTFYTVGRDFSVKDIDGFKEEVFNYLTAVMDEVDEFISKKGYIN